MTFVLETKKRCPRCQSVNGMIRILKGPNDNRFHFQELSSTHLSLEELYAISQRFPALSPKFNQRGWGCFCQTCFVMLPHWDLDDVADLPIVSITSLHEKKPPILAQLVHKQLVALDHLVAV